MRFRPMLAGDRPRIESILRSDATFRADEVAVALELVDDALQSKTSDYWFRLAESADTVVGYICYGPTPMTESTYDLYWIVVHASGRGQGVATKLIAEMEADLLARTSLPIQIRVETSQSEGYGAARKLYERCDYPESARFSNFYKEGDDLIVFFKSLTR